MSNSNDLGRVLVTGAGGFIGGHLVRRLAQEPAFTVIPATRDGRDGSRRLDLRDPGAMAAALAGVDAIVHCAVGDRAVTVDGTRALLAAAARAGVRRVVHISSVAVYGGRGGRLDENTPTVDPAGGDYGAWKAAAEQACLAQAGLEIVRLRPAIVYGPGSSLWISKMARRIESGRWGVFGALGEGTCNLVYISDVVNAIIASVTAKGVAGLALNVSGTETMTWNRWFTALAEALGAAPLKLIPPAKLRARVALSLPLKAVARFSPGVAADWLLGSPARSELALFALQASYPIDAARSALGWRPETGVKEGLVASVEWFREDAKQTVTL